MRIILNLNNYFHDHRSFARLFVNEAITTIGDLEEKVKDIFHIDGFHLISQNQYLPATEDVRLLSQDEVVWVVPNPSSQHGTVPFNSRSGKNEDSPEESTTKRKKNSLEVSSEKKVKKKKHREKIAELNFDNEEMETEETPIEKTVVNVELSVKKKNKQKRESAVVETEEIPVDDEEMSVKNKKQKKREFESESFIEPRGYFQATGTLPQRRRVTLPTGTEDYLKQKRINIVKIERISPMVNNEKEETKLEDVEKEETKLVDVEKEETKLVDVEKDETQLVNNEEESKLVDKEETRSVNEENAKKNEEVCKFSLLDFIKSRTKPQENLQIFNDSSKIEADSSQINNNVESSEKSYSSGATMLMSDTVVQNETIDETINRNLSSESEANESASSFFSRKNISGMGHVLSHLKSSEQDSQTSSTEKRKRKRTRKRKKTNEEKIFNSSLELTPAVKTALFNSKPKIHVKFEDTDTNDNFNEISVITINDTIEDFDFDPDFMLDEENLKKQPLMCSIFPKPNDVIVFKILRIAEDYTPTLSTYIAAKILNFNQNTKDVDCKILYGADQCVRPAGKFDLEDHEEEEDIPDIKTFSWKELFMPRLLFP